MLVGSQNGRLNSWGRMERTLMPTFIRRELEAQGGSSVGNAHRASARGPQAVLDGMAGQVLVTLPREMVVDGAILLLRS
jgi:hypothetical protein